MAGRFEPGLYEIRMRDDRPVAARLFKSVDEILDVIRDPARPPDLYDVYKPLPRDPDGSSDAERWGVVTKDERGNVTYDES